MKDPSLTIVIPTYTRVDLLETCLDSLAMQSYRDFQVVVVDDGSPVGPRIRNVAELRGASLVRLPKNTGFAVAANAGLAQAQTLLVMLLNDDMTLAPDCLERLVAGLTAHDADAAAPLVLWHDAPDVIYSAGDGQRVDGRPVALGFRCARSAFAPQLEVFGVSAGAALYRRSLFDEIGVFDWEYRTYYEDSDLNFRLQLAGFKAVCVAEAVAYHVGSASLADQNWRRARQCYRNHLRLFLKNMPTHLLVRNLIPFLRERHVQARSYRSAARAEFGFVIAWRMYFADAAANLIALPKLLARRCREKKISGAESAAFEAKLLPVERAERSETSQQHNIAQV